MVEAYPGYELVREELGGIAGYLGLHKFAAAPTLDIATFKYPLLDFNDLDVRKGLTAWREAEGERSSKLTFSDLTNAPHREMLREIASFEIGVLAWGMLEAVEEYSIDGILAALSAALYLEMRDQQMTDGERAGLKILSDSPYELATYLLGRLRGRCEIRGMSARVFIEQTMDYIETDPVGPLPEVFNRVFDTIRSRAAAERPKTPKKRVSQRKR